MLTRKSLLYNDLDYRFPFLIGRMLTMNFSRKVLILGGFPFLIGRMLTLAYHEQTETFLSFHSL